MACLTSNPETLCLKLIELNKNYILPKFNYKNKEDILLNINDSNLKHIYDSFSTELKLLLNAKNNIQRKGIYNKFCIKSINYL